MSREKNFNSEKIIGIMGGGQLGKMISIAASKLGYRTHVFASTVDSPAISVTNQFTIANFNDKVSLIKFAKNVDIITWEFENIPCNVIDDLIPFANVFPNKSTLRIAQNRLHEKKFIGDELHIPVVEYSIINSKEDLRIFTKEVGFPVVVKTVELGYDGRGQYKIYDNNELENFIFIDNQYIVEKLVNIKKEISVIIAVDAKKNFEFFPIAENYHVNGILDKSIIPADVSDELSSHACEIAKSIAFGLNLIGILVVEFFILDDNSLLVNEIAPRPHNSGHWTLDACNVDQFEQLIRAICNLPLKPTKLLFPCVMRNILGEDILNCDSYLENKNASLYIYGKKEVIKNRKMGHVNIINY